MDKILLLLVQGQLDIIGQETRKEHAQKDRDLFCVDDGQYFFSNGSKGVFGAPVVDGFWCVDRLDYYLFHCVAMKYAVVIWGSIFE